MYPNVDLNIRNRTGSDRILRCETATALPVLEVFTNERVFVDGELRILNNTGVHTHFNYLNSNVNYIRGNSLNIDCLTNVNAELNVDNGVFRVSNAVDNVGIRQLYNNVDLNVRNLSGNTWVLNCESNTGTNIFEVRANGNIYANGSIVHSSDRRLKKDIVPLNGSLNSVLKLRGVNFTWRQDVQGKKPTDRQVGFIAQEVESVIPELVKMNDEGFKAVSYANLTAHLVEAIKEQQKIIDILKLEQSEQDTEISDLQNRLAKLEVFVLNFIEAKTGDE